MTNLLRLEAKLWVTIVALVLGLFSQPVQASEKEANALIMQFYAFEKAQDYARAAKLFPANSKISIVWSFGALYPKERATVTPREWIEIRQETDAELAQYEKGFRETGRNIKITSSKTVGNTVQIQSLQTIHFIYGGKAGVIKQRDRFWVKKVGNVLRVVEWKSDQDLSDFL